MEESGKKFPASISHEIRTPLQTIIGMSELLEETALSDEQREYVRQIEFSAEALLAVVNGIPDKPGIEAGKSDAAYSGASDAIDHVVPLRVLFAEDHPVNRKIFVLIMEKLGVQTIEAEDGLDALEKAALHPDMIFMDIQMPRMNGYEAAAELRRRGFVKPIIALTAGIFEDEEAQYREADFDDILSKPLRKREIEAVIRRWNAETRPAADREQKALVFNGEELLDIFMQNADSAKTLLSHFLERCTMQIETLSVLTNDHNWTEAYRTAHSIKGSARTLSGMELGNSAAFLERACKQADLPKIESAIPVLIKSFTRFKIAAEEFIQS